MYFPDLAIYHYVPAERLTKSYYRRWCFWRGVSLSVLERTCATPGPHLLGAPRSLFGRAARAGLALVTRRVVEAPARFSSELAMWDLGGSPVSAP